MYVVSDTGSEYGGACSRYEVSDGYESAGHADVAVASSDYVNDVA